MSTKQIETESGMTSRKADSCFTNYFQVDITLNNGEVPNHLKKETCPDLMTFKIYGTVITSNPHIPQLCMILTPVVTVLTRF